MCFESGGASIQQSSKIKSKLNGTAHASRSPGAERRQVTRFSPSFALSSAFLC